MILWRDIKPTAVATAPTVMGLLTLAAGIMLLASGATPSDPERLHWLADHAPLPVIEVNKPPEFRDGSETLSYSVRLNAAYHPRPNYKRDLARMGVSSLVLVGESDQAIDADKLRALFAQHAPAAQTEILPGIDHFGVFARAEALVRIEAWIKSQAAA